MSAAAAGESRRAAYRRRVRALLLLALVLGTALLAAGYLVDGPATWVAVVAVAPAVVWAAARRHHPLLAADALLAAFVALAGAGLYLGLAAAWAVPAVVAGLAAWDLARFEQRLAAAGRAERGDTLAATHLLRLLPVLAISLLLGLAGAYVHLDLGFFPTLLLGVLAVAGLAATLAYLRRHGT